MCGVIPSLTPDQVRNEMSLAEALQYEILYYARNGVDCCSYSESQEIEDEINAITGLT